MNNVKTSLTEGFLAFLFKLTQEPTSRGKEGQPGRTPTTGENSPTVVLTMYSCFWYLPHIQRLLDKMKTSPFRVGWGFFPICCFTAIVLTVVNPIFMFNSPFSLQREQKCSSELRRVYDVHPRTKQLKVWTSIPQRICESAPKHRRHET